VIERIGLMVIGGPLVNAIENRKTGGWQQVIDSCIAPQLVCHPVHINMHG
jgi:hypothetical protein